MVLQVTADEPWNRNLKSQGSLTKLLSYTTNTESHNGFSFQFHFYSCAHYIDRWLTQREGEEGETDRRTLAKSNQPPSLPPSFPPQCHPSVRQTVGRSISASFRFMVASSLSSDPFPMCLGWLNGRERDTYREGGRSRREGEFTSLYPSVDGCVNSRCYNI